MRWYSLLFQRPRGWPYPSHRAQTSEYPHPILLVIPFASPDAIPGPDLDRSLSTKRTVLSTWLRFACLFRQPPGNVPGPPPGCRWLARAASRGSAWSDALLPRPGGNRGLRTYPVYWVNRIQCAYV